MTSSSALARLIWSSLSATRWINAVWRRANCQLSSAASSQGAICSAVISGNKALVIIVSPRFGWSVKDHACGSTNHNEQPAQPHDDNDQPLCKLLDHFELGVHLGGGHFQAVHGRAPG